MIKHFLALPVILISGFCFLQTSAIAQTSEFYSDRGDKRLDEDDYIGAIADYSRALELDPNNDALYHNRGMAKFYNYDEESSIRDFTKAIQIDPDYSESYLYRGKAKFYIDQCDSAISDLSASIQLKSKNTQAYYFRSACYNAIELYDNAYKDALKATRDNPDEHDYLQLGIASAYTENEQQAIQALTKSLSLNNEFADSYRMRGIVYEYIGQLQKACSDWTNAGKFGDTEAKSWVQDQCKSGAITVRNPSTSKPTLRETLSDTPFQWKR